MLNCRWKLGPVAGVVATALLAACASHPPPPPGGPPGPPPPPPSQEPPPEYGAPNPGVERGPLPGSAQDFVINIGDRVYFDFNGAQVRPDARPILDGQSAWLQRYPQVRVRIEGNCDERGTREYNFALGARRADAVRDYLIGRGIAAGRIATISFGKERPIDPGHDDAAWAKDRNAQTVITEGAR